MNKREGVKVTVALVASVLLVVIDQVTKYFAKLYLEDISTQPIIFQVLHFTYQENTGAAFSIFSGQRIWLSIVTALILLLLLLHLLLTKPPRSKLMLVSYSLVLAGGCGNLIDRVFRGYVVDFIDVRAVNFAIFNFADMCVVCGVIFMVIYLLLSESSKPKEETPESTEVPEDTETPESPESPAPTDPQDSEDE